MTHVILKTITRTRTFKGGGFGLIVGLGGNPIQVAPQCVIIDSGAQRIMIGKKLAHAVDGRRFGSLPIYHCHISWPRGEGHRLYAEAIIA